MNWSIYYPKFVEHREAEAVLSSGESEPGDSPVGVLKKSVEVADIGCGFGGLLVALAPMLPDILLLGMMSSQSQYMWSHDCAQVWRFERRSPNTSRKESELCELKMRNLGSIRTLPVYERTQ